MKRKNPRSRKQELYRAFCDALQRTHMGKGVPGFCGGARPAQIKAAAKICVDKVVSRHRASQRTEVAK